MAATDAFIEPEEHFLLCSAVGERRFGALESLARFGRLEGGCVAPKDLGAGIITEHAERFPSPSSNDRFLVVVRARGDSCGSAGGASCRVRAEAQGDLGPRGSTRGVGCVLVASC